jgi:hypothetical protein
MSDDASTARANGVLTVHKHTGPCTTMRQTTRRTKQVRKPRKDGPAGPHGGVVNIWSDPSVVPA